MSLSANLHVLKPELCYFNHHKEIYNILKNYVAEEKQVKSNT